MDLRLSGKQKQPIRAVIAFRLIRPRAALFHRFLMAVAALELVEA